jgi:hypothetical protein
MNIFRTPTASRLGIALAVLAFAPAASAQADRPVTQSHVYQAAQNLRSEIYLLREAMGIADFPPESEPLEDLVSVHVYAKSLEVMEKIARAQRRLGMAPANVESIPVKVIRPKDVLGSVESSISEIQRIKDELVIDDRITPSEFEGAKTSSHAYKALGDASFLLNGLVGRHISPHDVYERLQKVDEDLMLVAEGFGAALDTRLPAVEGRKRAKDVAQQVLRASYKTISLERRLDMDTSRVPTLTLVRVTPAEVYEAAGILLAEMARIKVHLGMTTSTRDERSDPSTARKLPTDIFAQVLLMIRNLDILIDAAPQPAY